MGFAVFLPTLAHLALLSRNLNAFVDVDQFRLGLVQTLLAHVKAA